MPIKAFTIGERFGSLKFIGPAEPTFRGNGFMQYRSVFLCDCGKEIIARNDTVRSGLTTSCGCARFKINIKHGQTRRGKRTRAYVIWSGVISRCENPNRENYQWYGGSNIKVCERWRNSFADFFDDMGPGKKGWTIERVGKYGNYEPSNCVWATMAHQSRNRRNNRIVTLRGITACLADLVERFGGNHNRICWRLDHGWTPEKAFSEPARKRIN